MKKYSVVGNKKKVTMETNNGRLKIVGNNCVVLVATNVGNIEVIGNDCKVEVADNYGSISYIGSNGQVNINKRWQSDRVQMLGPSCHLMVNGKVKPSATQEAQLSPFSKDLDDIIESVFTFVMR